MPCSSSIYGWAEDTLYLVFRAVERIEDSTTRANGLRTLCECIAVCRTQTGLVCGTGQLVQLVAALEGVVDVEFRMSSWEVRVRLAGAAADARTRVLARAAEEERSEYMEYGARLVEDMRSEFRGRARDITSDEDLVREYADHL